MNLLWVHSKNSDFLHMTFKAAGMKSACMMGKRRKKCTKNLTRSITPTRKKQARFKKKKKLVKKSKQVLPVY